MPGVTIYLDEMEERERKRRRRTRALGAVAIISLLFMATRQPETKIVRQTVVKEVRVPVDRIVTQTITQTVEKRVLVPVAEPRQFKLLPFAYPDVAGVDTSRPTRHLCVSPKRINFCGTTTSDRLTVSNVGDRPVRITQIGTVPERNGFAVNDLDCANRTLVAGEQCTIFVSVREAKGETMQLVIANDAGDPADAIRIESPTAVLPPSPPSAPPASRVPAS